MSAAATSNHYVETEELIGTNDVTKVFYAEDAAATFEQDSQSFFIRKQPADAEINVSKLSAKAQKLFKGPGGSREKEWTSICAKGSDGEAAVRVHRGHKARELRMKHASRVIPSRWHEKWKDMGDSFNNGLGDPSVPKHLGAKSR